MSISGKEFEDMMKKSHCKIIYDSGKKKRIGRVSSQKIEVHGVLLDSKAEVNIYWECFIDDEVEIIWPTPMLEKETFILLKPFKRKNKSYQGITYTPDFKIKIYGVEWIIEVKSRGTLRANSKSYPLRRKLFLNKFPDLNFREIIFDGKKRTEINY